MAFEDPLWVQGDGTTEYSAREFRRLIEALAQPGVFRPDSGALAVSQRSTGANFSVDVAAGQCAVAGTSQAGQGHYLCTNDAVVNVPVPAAPGANSRIDLVIVRMPAIESGPPALEIVQGAAGAAPAAPAVPDDALVLAEILIASTDASVTDAMITDRRVNAVGSGTPTGAVLPFAGTAIPEGWLLANGTGVSRAEFAALFSAIGTTYGAGDGVTTFNLPNLTARFPVGAGGQYDLGDTGGLDEVALSQAEMPSHQHGVQRDEGIIGSPAGVPLGAETGGFVQTTETGDGEPHENRPPFLALSFVIKT